MKNAGSKPAFRNKQTNSLKVNDLPTLNSGRYLWSLD
jgi:hypothetical protein